MTINEDPASKAADEATVDETAAAVDETAASKEAASEEATADKTFLCHFLGTPEDYENRWCNDQSLVMSIQGNYQSVVYFDNIEQSFAWGEDCMVYRRLEPVVNLYAGTPKHRIGFVKFMIPAFINLYRKWGVERTPPDIRFSIRDGYEYFNLGPFTFFPQDIMVEVKKVSSDSNEVTVEMV